MARQSALSMRAAAEGFVRAGPAPALEQRLAISQFVPQRMGENLRQRLSPDVAEDDGREELVGVHATAVVDGENALAGRVAAATSKNGLHTASGGVAVACPHPAEQAGAIGVVSAGHDVQSGPAASQSLGCLEEPLEQRPALLWLEVLAGQLEPASGVEQVREIEPIDAPRDRPFEERLHLAGVPARDREPDPHRHAGGLGAGEAGRGTIERSGHAAVGVVEGREAVQAHPDVGDARRGQCAGHALVQEHAAGRQERPETDRARVRGQINEVVAQERLAAAQDQDADAGVRKPLDQPRRVGCREVVRGGLAGGGRVAVRTVQVAVAADVPHDDRR